MSAERSPRPAPAVTVSVVLPHGESRPLTTAGPPRPAGRRCTAIALAGILALGLALLAGDRWLRAQEFHALVDRVGAGQATVAYADGRILSAVSYTSPALGSADISPEVARSLEQLIQGTAAGQEAAVGAGLDRTARTRVLPWHTAQRLARARCVAYLAGRRDYLAQVAASFDVLYRSSPDARRQLLAARAALTAAAPDATAARRVAAALP